VLSTRHIWRAWHWAASARRTRCKLERDPTIGRLPDRPATTRARTSGHPPVTVRRSWPASLIARHLTYTRLEDAATRVHVVATDLLSGSEVVLSEGDAVSAVLASTAIPGILPAVQRDGLTLVDGGLADNAAISVAVALGASTVFVLPTGYSCALTQPPTSALAVALQSLGLLIQQQLITDVAHFAEHVDLKVLPPLCPVAVSPSDFRQASSLIERAYAASVCWIDSGGLDLPHPERFLSLHRHEQQTLHAKVRMLPARGQGTRR
jgi:NTE family protein